jgi:amino acid transporter
MGSTIQDTLNAEYSFNFPWWAFLLIAITATAVFTYPGVRVGIKALFVLSAFELLVILALAITGLFDPGPGGFSFSGFDPSHAPKLSEFYLGITFAIFALTGWDAAAPLSEESKTPRRTIGRGVIISILIMGAFLVIAAWGLTVGAGTSHIGGFADASENPAFTLGHRVWGGAWIIVLLAVANSTIAVLISSMNASTRMWWRMARVGALPKFLGKTHPKYKTPTNAILFQTGLSIVLGLGLGLIWGQENVFTVLGFLFIFAVIPAWVLANVGVYRFYRREHPDEFHWFKHIVVPVFSSIGLLWVAYKSIIPLPPAPSNAAPFIVGIWLLIGIGILVWMRARGKEGDLMSKAGEAMDESSSGVGS